MRSITLPLIVLICFVVSCGNHSTGNSSKVAAALATQQNTAPNQSAPDTTKWIDNFRTFRDAVYQGNKEKVKQFFEFPVTDEQNGVWNLVYSYDEKKLATISGAKPFTEKDFDKYFDALFPKRFINSLLKVKSEELWKTGSTETKGITDGNTTYTLSATFDKSDNTLTLGLGSKTPYKTDDGEMDAAEFGEIYQFTVLSNGKIKFVRVLQAG